MTEIQMKSSGNLGSNGEVTKRDRDKLKEERERQWRVLIIDPPLHYHFLASLKLDARKAEMCAK